MSKRSVPSGPAEPRRLARRLVTETRPYRGRLVLLLLVELAATPLLLLAPVPLKIIVDSVLADDPVPRYLAPALPASVGGDDLRLLTVAAVMQVLVVGAIQLQQLLSYALRVRTGEAMTKAVRERLFSHAQGLSLRHHDAIGTTDSVYRIQYDAAELQRVTVGGLLTMAASAVTLMTTLVVIAALDWQLALLALAVGPALVVVTRRYRLRVRPRYHDIKGYETDAMRIVHEALGALRVVKAFGREDEQRERFSDAADVGVRARVSVAWAEGWFGLMVNLVTAVGTATVLFLGVLHVRSGVVTLGELLMIIAYLAQLYAPLQTISQKVATLQSSLASAERVFDFLDEPPDVPQSLSALPLVRPHGHLEFRHVSLRYGAGPDVLRDVCLTIPPGQRLGISGVTGAGKTSLVSLLLRFYDPTAGQVLMDGVDLRDLRLPDLRGQVAVVLQEPVLFSCSIAENIRFARPGADLAAVAEAAAQADALDFISALPDGFETLVGERGMQLSGGERQRISIARAFLKGGRFLVLDEPTSSVDLETESRILRAMDHLMEGRTTLLIAHRASTLSRCDAHVRLEGGRVASTRSGNGQGIRGGTP